MKVEYFGEVNSEGQLKITNRKKFDADLLKYFTGKQIEITVQKKKKFRSNMQNAYYWGVVVPIIKQGLIDMGNECSNNDVHEFLKAKFNFKELVNQTTGEVVNVPQSTANITTSAFMDYIASIQKFAAEFLNSYVPDPNEDLKLEL